MTLTVEELLHQVAGRQWHVSSEGIIRCEQGLCPIIAAWASVYRVAKCIEDNRFAQDYALLFGISSEEAIALIIAADGHRGSMRTRILEVLKPTPLLRRAGL